MARATSFFVHEVKERVVAEDDGDSGAMDESGQRSGAGWAERVHDAKHSRIDVRESPERSAGKEIGGNEISELRKGFERQRGLVFGVIERRVAGGAVVRMATDEDRLLDAVPMGEVEDRLGAAEVDAIAVFAMSGEMGDRGHVDHRVGFFGAKYVFRGALADVRLVHRHTLGRVGPGTPIDADDLMPGGEKLLGHEAPHLARDSRDQDSHVASYCFRPCSMRWEMRDFTSFTLSRISWSSSSPVPERRIGSP